MSLLQRAVRNVRAELRGSSGEFGDSSIPTNSSFGWGGAGSSPLTEQGALAISTVYLCAKVLYEDQTILPLIAYQGQKRGARRPIERQPLIVTQPFGPDMSRGAGFGQIRLSLAMRGNAYIEGITWSGGYPTQVKVAHPDRVQVRANPDDGVKEFSIQHGPWVRGDRVKHIMGPSLPGALKGLDPITFMRVTLSLASEVAQYGANFFSNGGSPSGVISVKGPGNATNAREVKETWEAGHAGVVNAHRPAVLFGGATWTPMSVTPENAQFLQTRRFSREEICGWFGVPLQRIQAIVDNASQGGGKGLDTIEHGYVAHTMLPVNTEIEAAWDEFIPGDQSSWTLFDYDALLRVDALTRAQIAQIHRLVGLRNRDEIRGDEGWEPIGGPDGEDYNVPFNTNTHLPAIVEPGEEASPVDPTAVPGTNGGQQ